MVDRSFDPIACGTPGPLRSRHRWRFSRDRIGPEVNEGHGVWFGSPVWFSVGLAKSKGLLQLHVGVL